MGRGIQGLEQCYRMLFVGALIILAVLMILCLIRAIRGPRIADRIVAVNMMGTMVITMIGVLALMLGEGYLVDICIIYALISFLAVIVLTKVYMGVYLEKRSLQKILKEKIKMAVIEWIRFLIGALFLLSGLVIFIFEIIGVFRFKYVLNRMHAAAMGDTLGIGSSFLGLMIMNGLNFTTLKMFLVVLFCGFPLQCPPI